MATPAPNDTYIAASEVLAAIEEAKAVFERVNGYTEQAAAFGKLANEENAKLGELVPNLAAKVAKLNSLLNG